MKIKEKCLKSFKIVVAVILVATGVLCIVHRIPQCFDSQNPMALVAATFTLTNGKYKLDENNINKTNKKSDTISDDKAEALYIADKSEKRDKTGYYDSFSDHLGETKYDIEERTISSNATQVANCFIKNKTGLSLNFDDILKKTLTFDVNKNTTDAQVLIYHTHTSEAYMDEDVDYFYNSFYSRTSNQDYNVIAVGNAIAEVLNKKGIKTIHDTTVHDTTYNGSYDRSAATIENNLKSNKGIKVVLDIHRDAIGTAECKVKPVFTYNGKKGAQIMILSGCDTDGEMGFTHWQNNLSFALKIQNTAESMYPGMTRPLSFDYFAYNEYICDGSLLIEVGAEANFIEEAVYTGQLLGNVLSKVLL